MNDNRKRFKVVIRQMLSHALIKMSSRLIYRPYCVLIAIALFLLALLPFFNLYAQEVDLGQYGIVSQDLNADPCGFETVRHIDGTSVNIVRSVYGLLDLDARSKQVDAGGQFPALVPLGPILAVGEGEHPENHTVVRILNKYQLREVQFLAYPPEVLGGVGVEAIPLDASAAQGFICYPLTDNKTTKLRIFNRYGGLVRELDVAKEISPPFVVAVGDFVSTNAGVEIAIASRFRRGPVLICLADGAVLQNLTAPMAEPVEAEIALIAQTSGNAKNLIYHDMQQKNVYVWQGATGFIKKHELTTLTEGSKIFDSVFPGRSITAGDKDELVSTLFVLKEEGKFENVDVGLRENSFNYLLARQHGAWYSEWPKIPDTKYVHEAGSMGAFFEAQNWSPLVAAGDIKNKSKQEWIKDLNWETSNFLPAHLQKTVAPWKEFASGVPKILASPNFTHRWKLGPAKTLIGKKRKDGSPEYLALSRNNTSIESGYFGKILFAYGSYNYEQPELQDYYTYALWEFHRQFAKYYRQKADNLILAKPSHENEVETGKDSLGDYNVDNIKGFYRYLLALYGDRETLNKKFGIEALDTRFDAPRNLGRGPWDEYSVSNTLFCEWVEYNRVNVYRRVGDALIGVVIAGIPPQLLRTHQIPDYAIGGTIGIGDNARRITPVDWLLTAGTGFGFTRYGLWYNKTDMAQGAYTSGFDDVFVGEYASKAKTSQREEAFAQLKCMVDNGIKGALVMSWPDEDGSAGYNETQYAALQKLHSTMGNTPLPGMAGGISQIRAVTGPSGKYDIAALGCNERNTGLLKSLNADGSFEGTVYVVPFHSHVDITLLKAEEDSQSVHWDPVELCKLPEVRQGCLVEINFDLPPGRGVEAMEVRLYHDNVEMPGQRTVLRKLAKGSKVRVIYKFPVILENLSLALACPRESVSISNLKVYQHQDMAANLTKQISTGKRHQGGVQFAVLGNSGGEGKAADPASK